MSPEVEEASLVAATPSIERSLPEHKNENCRIALVASFLSMQHAVEPPKAAFVLVQLTSTVTCDPCVGAFPGWHGGASSLVQDPEGRAREVAGSFGEVPRLARFP